ncbi:hypothetical protein JTE90_029101 [Oedothorax gibbosus]|uniref:Uncharacterized protein n=1 Tax=Oedothorax gibbosus TaxID=931172 RepID=A0AAV6V6N7_9ARAC|nr:hypothetical protein JTE90_029101 [Oedothorax gibbosus]
MAKDDPERSHKVVGNIKEQSGRTIKCQRGPLDEKLWLDLFQVGENCCSENKMVECSSSLELTSNYKKGKWLYVTSTDGKEEGTRFLNFKFDLYSL